MDIIFVRGRNSLYLVFKLLRGLLYKTYFKSNLTLVLDEELKEEMVAVVTRFQETPPLILLHSFTELLLFRLHTIGKVYYFCGWNIVLILKVPFVILIFHYFWF